MMVGKMEEIMLPFLLDEQAAFEAREETAVPTTGCRRGCGIGREDEDGGVVVAALCLPSAARSNFSWRQGRRSGVRGPWPAPASVRCSCS